MITHTISLTELIWTFFSFIAFVYNFRITRRSLQDLDYVRVRKINSIREYSARLTVVTYTSWTVVQGVFVLMGAIAMTIAPTTNRAVTPFQIVLTSGFLAVSILLAVIAYVNERGRIALLRKIRLKEAQISSVGGSIGDTG